MQVNRCLRLFSLPTAEAPSVLQAPEKFKAAEGRTVTFVCRMDGAPKPEIQWTRGESKTTVSGERFRILANGDLEILVST